MPDTVSITELGVGVVELKIELLGGFRVSVNGQPIDDRVWRHRKAQSLIKLLALAKGFRLHREQLMELLWPEADLEAMGNNLRQALYLARKSLREIRLNRSSVY